MIVIMTGMKNDVPNIKRDFRSLYFFKMIKLKQNKKKNSMATGTLNKKARPKNKPDQKRYFSNNKNPKIVGKSMKISALAIWPSITGIEVKIINKSKAIGARLIDR